jgi:peptidoglycan/LPS O-acetylase OafA/YrhL
MLRSGSLVGRILNYRPLVAMGKVSYPVYLRQQAFLLVKRGDEPYAVNPLNLGLPLL